MLLAGKKRQSKQPSHMLAGAEERHLMTTAKVTQGAPVFRASLVQYRVTLIVHLQALPVQVCASVWHSTAVPSGPTLLPDAPQPAHTIAIHHIVEISEVTLCQSFTLP